MALLGIVWLNYNGLPIMRTIRSSLYSIERLSELVNNKLKLIIVDNASSDGSYELIRNMARRMQGNNGLDVLVIRNSRNLGFTGGMNRGFEILRGKTSFIAVMNNDIVLDPLQVSRLIRVVENTSEKIGAFQGIILDRNRNIDNAGYIVDELLLSHPVKIKINKPIPVTYVNGSFAIYKYEALSKCGMGEKLFFEEIPAFFDDNIVGLRLWNCGFLSIAAPISVGIHLHGATFQRYSAYKIFNTMAAYTAKSYIVRSRYSRLIPLMIAKLMAYNIAKHGGFRPTLATAAIRGIRYGAEIGSRLRKKIRLSLYKAPYIKVQGPGRLINMLLKPRSRLSPSAFRFLTTDR